MMNDHLFNIIDESKIKMYVIHEKTFYQKKNITKLSSSSVLSPFFCFLSSNISVLYF
jgi:hypothetical protein